MKLKLSIFITNWINLTIVLIASYLFSVINELLLNPINQNTLMLAFLGSLFLILMAVPFIIGFIILSFILEIFFLVDNKSKLNIFLVFEWGIISIPLIYCASLYEKQRYIFIVVVIVLFISQLFFRKRTVIKMLN